MCLDINNLKIRFPTSFRTALNPNVLTGNTGNSVAHHALWYGHFPGKTSLQVLSLKEDKVMQNNSLPFGKII
ncbi:MAG TPA: hypothetical protein VIY08_13620 [Candidatus Nitrosocosmicus sp.]